MPHKTQTAWEMLQSWRNQSTPLPGLPQIDLTGRTVIVTGSNTGIGMECARHLAKLNPARLVLAVRRPEAGATAAASIAASAGVDPKCRLEVWKLDMASLASVKAFADRCEKELDRVDILVANAGMNPWEFKLTDADGLEQCVQVNTIATVFLCAMLVPLLNRAAKLPVPTSSASATSPFRPHLTIVSSGAHLSLGELDGLEDGTIFQRANLPENYANAAGGNMTYARSKAVTLMAMPELVARTRNSVLVDAVDPGLVHSDTLRDFRGAAGLLTRLFYRLYARSTEEGGKAIAWAAIAPLAKSGLYCAQMAVSEPSELVRSDTTGQKGIAIWRELAAIWKDKAGVDLS